MLITKEVESMKKTAGIWRVLQKIFTMTYLIFQILFLAMDYWITIILLIMKDLVYTLQSQ